MASSVDSKLLKSTRFPSEFSQKVDMKKVNVEVMKKYRAPLLPVVDCFNKPPLQVDCWQDLGDTRERR